MSEHSCYILVSKFAILYENESKLLRGKNRPAPGLEQGKYILQYLVNMEVRKYSKNDGHISEGHRGEL